MAMRITGRRETLRALHPVYRDSLVKRPHPIIIVPSGKEVTNELQDAPRVQHALAQWTICNNSSVSFTLPSGITLFRGRGTEPTSAT